MASRILQNPKLTSYEADRLKKLLEKEDRLGCTRSAQSHRRARRQVISNFCKSVVKSRLSIISKKKKELDSWNSRIKRQIDWEENLETLPVKFSVREKAIESKQTAIDELQESIKPAQDLLFKAKEYNRYQEEYQYCVERAAKLKEKMGTIDAELQESPFYTRGDGTRVELESICAEVSTLPRRREIRRNAGGRTMMSDATTEERIYYHRMDLLNARYGIIDPNAPGNTYKKDRFFLTARSMGWMECPEEEKLRHAAIKKTMKVDR